MKRKKTRFNPLGWIVGALGNIVSYPFVAMKNSATGLVASIFSPFSSLFFGKKSSKKRVPKGQNKPQPNPAEIPPELADKAMPDMGAVTDGMAGMEAELAAMMNKESQEKAAEPDEFQMPPMPPMPFMPPAPKREAPKREAPEAAPTQDLLFSVGQPEEDPMEVEVEGDEEENHVGEGAEQDEMSDEKMNKIMNMFSGGFGGGAQESAGTEEPNEVVSSPRLPRLPDAGRTI